MNIKGRNGNSYGMPLLATGVQVVMGRIPLCHALRPAGSDSRLWKPFDGLHYPRTTPTRIHTAGLAHLGPLTAAYPDPGAS
jgi:hypothetical protein